MTCRRTTTAMAACVVVLATTSSGCGFSQLGLSTPSPVTSPALLPARGASSQVPSPTSQSSMAARPVTAVSSPMAAAQLASRFAVDWLSYDSRRQTSRAILTEVHPLVTTSLQQRLGTSPRVLLDWRALRARSERTVFRKTSASVWTTPERRGGAVVVVVVGRLVTFSSIGRIVTRERIEVLIIRTPEGLRIAGAHGGGA